MTKNPKRPAQYIDSNDRLRYDKVYISVNVA
jgi:hypothetical protein